MSVKKFEAPTIIEAYSRLKREMGTDAFIVKTRTFKKGGILGLWGRKVVEITATDSAPGAKRRKSKSPALTSSLMEKIKAEISAPAVRKMASSKEEDEQNLPDHQGKDEYIPNKKTTTQTPLPPTSSKPIPSPSTDKKQKDDPKKSPAKKSKQPDEHSIVQLKKDLAEIRQMVADMQDEGKHRHWPDLPPEFQKAFIKLQSLNISESISRALIHRWKSHYSDYKKGMRVETRLLEDYIGEMIVPAGPIQLKENGTNVVMMIGPTGVGKTTSIAKLAAKFKLSEGLDVALITIDTYRIAAVEQLRTYADLIGVPLKVVSVPEDLEAAIKQFKDKDLVLIDTAGRSPKNRTKMNELRRFVEAASPDELHLVVSANVHNDVMQDILERYDHFPINKLLLTKLDEAVHLGILLSIISKTQKPIGYLSTGQQVPEDIEVAEIRRLARLILGLEKIHA